LHQRSAYRDNGNAQHIVITGVATGFPPRLSSYPYQSSSMAREDSILLIPNRSITDAMMTSALLGCSASGVLKIAGPDEVDSLFLRIGNCLAGELVRLRPARNGSRVSGRTQFRWR
jgi:hypothetical protein